MSTPVEWDGNSDGEAGPPQQAVITNISKHVRYQEWRELAGDSTCCPLESPFRQKDRPAPLHGLFL